MAPFNPYSQIIFAYFKKTFTLLWCISSNNTILDVDLFLCIMYNLHFMILRLLWRPSWILAPPSWKLTNFDWLTRKIPITHANEHFYQVSCLYPDVHDCYHFPLHLPEISRWLQNSYVKQSGKQQKEGTCRYKHETWLKCSWAWVIWIFIISQSKLAYFQDGGTKIQDGRRKKKNVRSGNKDFTCYKAIKTSKMV